ncbi:MAG: acyltransferase [Candidatus Eremiobacteraeota bacterium]|nr:acyltransferase [Candidatus Eremiobacteraeota bacterium]
MSEKATYLPGLNGVRAIAASIVLLWHTDEYASLFGLSPYGYGKTGMGGSAVTFFFVLSGFLITLLLLQEKARFGTVDVPRFYGRRILRIWPVYYVAVAAAFLWVGGLPTDQWPQTVSWVTPLTLYGTFLPNAAYAFGVSVRSIQPLWSVGVEEQFYLLWPWVVRASKNLLATLFGIAMLVVVIKTSLRIWENGPLLRLARLTSIDSMAVGGMLAWLVHHRHPFLRYLYSRAIQIFCWLFFLICVFYKPLQFTSLYDSELHALIYAGIIANVSTNPRTIISLENSVFNFVGRVSYGLYVYHMLVICVLAAKLSPSTLSFCPERGRLLVVILAVYFLTLAVALISYRFMESPLLEMKKKLARVQSTDKKSDADE